MVGEKEATNVLSEGAELLALHHQDEALDIKLVPVNLNWGRKPTKEKIQPPLARYFQNKPRPLGCVNFLSFYFWSPYFSPF